MKHSHLVFTTDNAQVLRKLRKAIVNRYTVEFPAYESRKWHLTTVVWTIDYHSNDFFGNSENALNSIANYVTNEHVKHSDHKGYDAIRWTVYSD